MKKTYLLSFFILCFTLNSHAQVEQIDKTEINLGVGLLPTIISSTFGIPLSVSVDHPFSVVEHMTIGGYAGYYRTSDNYNYGFGSYDINYNVLLFGARATYHVGHFEWMKWMGSDKFDPYVGVMAGFNYISSSIDGDNTFVGDFTAASSGPSVSGFVGVKYQLTDSFRVFGEAGYGISLVTVGAVLAF